MYDYDSKPLLKMIRFDTFIVDYDTKNVIVFSNKIVLLPVRQTLPKRFACRRYPERNDSGLRV